MEEKELITVGLGNYATLVAAQWANGTSHFDTRHPTLYRERRADRVVGGGGGGGGAGAAEGDGRRVRVPRLVLLDAPHATHLTDLSDARAEMEKRENEEDGGGDAGNGDADDGDAGSLLFGKRGRPASGLLGGAELTAEETELERLVRYTQRSVWRDGLRGDAASGDEEGTSDDEEKSDGDGDDEGYQYHRNRHNFFSGERIAENEESDTDGETSKEKDEKDAPRSKKALMRRLFRQRDATVPWWQYITTGLDADSLTSLRPLPPASAAGEVPAYHSFGHGLGMKAGGGASGASAAEMERVAEALRRQLEDADRPQGAQAFVEGDSMFGGVAVQLLEGLWEDAGPKLPVAVFNLLTPLPAAVTAPGSAVPFAQRRVEESALNTLLSTSLLSAHPSAVYVPLEVRRWPQLFAASAGAAAGGAPAWLDHDPATAQYAAAVVDTMLYGVRDSGAPLAGGEAARESFAGPAFYLQEWARTVRPVPSMRVASALGAVPLPLRDARGNVPSFARFLDAHPLLPFPIGSAGDASASAATTTYVPLSHAFAASPQTEAGRVLGHAWSLRGAGAFLTSSSPSSPSAAVSYAEMRQEALRYAVPLRTANYLPLIAASPYPLSSTFPLPLLLGAEAAEAAAAQLNGGRAPANAAEAAAAEERLRQAMGGAVEVAAHVCTTHAAAPMLAAVAAEAQPVLRHVGKMTAFNDVYGLEQDEWRERLEDVLQMADDYRHGDGDDDDKDGSESSFSGEDGW